MADTALIDIVRPVCPGWHQHRHLRRWVASLPSQAWQDHQGDHLLVTEGDPCTWRVITEPLHWQEELEKYGSTTVSFTYSK